jgi:hypothetical protein
MALPYRQWEKPEVNRRDADNPYEVPKYPNSKKLYERKFFPEQLREHDGRNGSDRQWLELWPNRYLVPHLRARNSLEGQLPRNPQMERYTPLD